MLNKVHRIWCWGRDMHGRLMNQPQVHSSGQESLRLRAWAFVVSYPTFLRHDPGAVGGAAQRRLQATEPQLTRGDEQHMTKSTRTRYLIGDPYAAGWLRSNVVRRGGLVSFGLRSSAGEKSLGRCCCCCCWWLVLISHGPLPTVQTQLLHSQ
ncbi:hypothetical protein BS78_04G024400 [Paspalum vaginatum]|nr:hypothetical protein BS78_04G024400 [Paspalum vaginatum]